jgi:hypothetical protein
MPKKADLVSELNWITEKISSQVWTLNLGTLGTTWSLVLADGLTILHAIWVFVPGLISLVCEMGQYLSGYWLARRLLTDMERNNREEFQYPKSSFLYRARQFFFGCKIVLTVIAAVVLVFTLMQELLT